jgi:DNA-binding transcriptional regulator YhcF (GntR family)/GAF domain-containing protein
MAQTLRSPSSQTATDSDRGTFRRIDPATERALDRMTRLSAALLRATTAHAYLGDRRSLQLRSSYPASIDRAATDPVSLALADEVIRTERCADLRRYADVTSVLDGRSPANISSLGVPLLAPDGRLVGALTITDVADRDWSSQEVQNLVDLAVGGMAELQLVQDGLDDSADRDQAGAIAPGSTIDEKNRDPAATITSGDRPGTLTLVPDPTGLVRETSRARARGWRAPLVRRVMVGTEQTDPPARGLLSKGQKFRLHGDGSEGGQVMVEVIRERIVGALHVGALRAGDRLPSIRQTAREFAVTPYAVLQCYAELEVEGLVERRERSGVFVAEFEIATAAALPETGAWLTEVLTQACQHQVKIPHLPDLIRRWTSAVRVRCACVESCLDSRIALGLEVSQQFGIEASEVAATAKTTTIRDADIVITTAYHAAQVGSLAAELGKPLLIATISPLILSAALSHLRERDLTVICVDSTYGERLRSLHGGAYRNRVRVITIDDKRAVAELDRSEPVLLTPAARQRLQQPDFRLIAPVYPSYSIDFASKMAEALVRINLQGARA